MEEDKDGDAGRRSIWQMFIRIFVTLDWKQECLSVCVCVVISRCGPASPWGWTERRRNNKFHLSVEN